ncbi:hypothetical protein DSO57_1009523 [Entomophthora muscae]|uniref:Uncharacterized protein n=1 Tax=Entomophthora muscae TaxID=34485 RepID=A0ACC2USM3_9FUNG|nr:hypothetical protein DSO57_1009523 [Entomophthora muscae]
MFYNVVFVLGVSCFCPERSDIGLDTTRYLAALEELNSGPAPTKWDTLVSKLTPESFEEDTLLASAHLFLKDVEYALQEIDSSVTIPLWDAKSDGRVFSSSRFGISPSPEECINSIPLSGFKHKDGTCLKRQQLGRNLRLFTTLDRIPLNKRMLFNQASTRLLEMLTVTVFQSLDPMYTIEDPLFLSILARLNEAWQAFLIKSIHQPKKSLYGDDMEWIDTLIIEPWGLTTAEVVQAYLTSCEASV